MLKETPKPRQESGTAQKEFHSSFRNSWTRKRAQFLLDLHSKKPRLNRRAPQEDPKTSRAQEPVSRLPNPSTFRVRLSKTKQRARLSIRRIKVPNKSED